MLRILTVLGARPQFIKAAAVSRAIAGRPGLEEVVVHTGQHFDANMSAVFFDELGMRAPEHNLAVAGGTHGEQTGRMLAGVERVLRDVRPDWVLVYGDTNSTLAGALAAAKLLIPIAHVEAGLRSFNRRMPEEVNRVLTDHASDLLFAPTRTAVENLAREGITGDRVARVGDVMYDAARHYGALAEERSRVIEALGLVPGGYVLATVHRQENTDDVERLATIVEALAETAAELPVVLPLHPRTRKALAAAGLLGAAERVLRVIDPVGYLDIVMLERRARIIATDSGGMQKEAFFHRVPCVTLRDETEWVELVESGWNRLAPPSDRTAVRRELRRALDATERGASAPDLYGAGNAASLIVDRLVGVASARLVEA
ncbi:MAG: UDP-2,3-diacetamido-2,3-dideoxy-D-glucuronic acid 2-epimerase [uncultured Gemmatimonadaceae bacterium]|uniref:UDP-2,3-diacetamido-2,3-dideoxy-D-glucuronic acid 2-epimerase n=1 Tax=uncultured Gemmatimonadaceae bacterium TaxID=246130 RepID=A0A6J4MGU2_9BACT|nr:MAG: UDP-2,3-diacetamido-2,3-dideoxy-D-glucuronic acid 2-epimerase [uncultured Gemmatimonadaceae bacterium]